MHFTRNLSLGLVCLAAAAPVAAQDHPNIASGFAADRLFDFSGVDNVNVFSGTLNLTIPIGPTYNVNGDLSYGLVLVYDSNPWRFGNLFDPVEGEPVPAAFKKGENNAGFGWRVGLGNLVRRDTGDPSLTWFYVSRDGAEHRFYDTLHEGETNETDVFYTRDGSYIRMQLSTVAVCGSTGHRQVETTDKLIHCFSDHDPSPSTENWELDQIRDRFGNSVLVTYPTDQIVLTDGHARQTTIHLETDNGTPIPLPRITQIDLPAFGGQTATYLFSYTDTVIDYSLKDFHSQHSTLTVSLLDEVILPDDTPGDSTDNPRWEMLDYHTTATGTIDTSGLLKELRLPTRGLFEWSYKTYQLPKRQGADSFLEDSTGVATRTHREADGTLVGTWQHEGSGASVDIIQPTGDCERHYFATDPNSWDYGLTFSLTQPQDRGRSLSMEVWESNDGSSCTGVAGPLRSTYVTFDKDILPTIQEIDGTNWYNTNRRLTSTHTVYHDDGDRFAETSWATFDGLGHYRNVTTSGDFGAGDVRATFTNYNPHRGTYPAAFTMLPSSDPWVIDTFERETVTEDAASATELFCFDADGFLLRRRTMVGATTGANDVIAAFEPAGTGNVQFERYYGADTQDAPTGTDPFGADFCDASLQTELDALTPTYEFRHFYSSGTRRRSRYMNGGMAVLRFLELTIDPNTGLPSVRTDISDLDTTLTYDLLGRLTSETPEANEGSKAIITYDDASASTKVNVKIERVTNPGAALLAEEQVVFDDFGRIFQEKRRLPSGTFNLRETLYDARGRKTSVSEVEPDGASPANRTQFLEYDPFGRPGRIRLADGASHDVTLVYAGVRQVQRTVAIERGGGELPSTTTEVFDRQRRLQQVIEPSGEAGALVTTTYGYDVGDRLSSASTTATVTGDSVTQTRLFNYDNLGFLRSEQHPEKGATGNGTVLFGNYDARGNAGQRQDNGVDLTFTYDRAERLLQVKETAGLGRVLKKFKYGADNAGTNPTNRLKGKLEEATRHNYLIAFPNQDLQITEVFTYEEIGGRVSKRETQRTDVGPSPTPRTTWFETEFEWTELGDLEVVTYPTCTISVECDAAGNPSGQPTRSITNGYLNGFLRSVSGFADPITYHPNEMLASIAHTNGVTDLWNNDPNSMRRPARIRTTGVVMATDFDTQTYSYDGAGNIAGVESDSFSYDGVSRLVSRTDSAGEVVETATYDAFGNRTGALTLPVGSRAIPIDPETNRALGRMKRPISYDSRGNQTQWGAAAFTYDEFDHLILQVDSGSGTDLSYIYTADDERIVTIDNTTPSETWTIRDLDGLVLRKFFRLVGDTDWQKDTIHRQGQVLATDGLAGTHHAHLDHLGTIRLWTRSTDATVFSRHDYTAFGEEIVDTLDNQDHRYTSHERDILRSGCTGTTEVNGQTLDMGQVIEDCDAVTSENTTVTSTDEVRFRAGDFIALGEGFTVADNAVFVAETDGSLSSDLQDLDYMHARYCSPMMGRFLRVDPADEREALKRPQKWNRYSYVENNPLAFVDPDGRESAQIWLDLDQQALLRGEISREEFRANIRARGFAAGVGAVGGFGVLAATSASAGGALTAIATTARVGAIRLGLGLSVTSAPVVSNPRLLSIVNQLFKTGDKLRGGTANAIRFTLATGRRVGGSFHLQAGLDRLKSLQDTIRGGGLSAQDARTAARLARDLENALNPLLQRLNLNADQVRKALARGRVTEEELLRLARGG